MKLTTRTRYGTRLLVDLAVHYGTGNISLRDVSVRQNISLHYLHHIITPLLTGGIVFTSRGTKGGVFLSKPPENIKLSEVIKLLEGSIAPVDCVDSPAMCKRSESCVTRQIWHKIKLAVDNVLDSITLKELADKQKQKNKKEQFAIPCK
jgi:Rrf2 family cysteine metabolism transcriptional repressor